MKLWDLYASHPSTLTPKCSMVSPVHSPRSLLSPHSHHPEPAPSAPFPSASLWPSPERGLTQEVAAHFLLWPLLIWEVRRVDVPTLRGGKLECVFQSLLRDPTTCHFYILHGLKQTSAGRLIWLPPDRARLTVSLGLHAKLSKQMFIKETWGWCRLSHLPFSKRANKGIFPKW